MINANFQRERGKIRGMEWLGIKKYSKQESFILVLSPEVRPMIETLKYSSLKRITDSTSLLLLGRVTSFSRHRENQQGEHVKVTSSPESARGRICLFLQRSRLLLRENGSTPLPRQAHPQAHQTLPQIPV